MRDIKLFVSEETGIPSKRIKLLGPFGAAGTSENDVVMLNQFEKKLKKNQTFVVTVMGTPDAELTAFEQGSSNQAGEGVLNDFGHNFAPASKGKFLLQNLWLFWYTFTSLFGLLQIHS